MEEDDAVGRAPAGDRLHKLERLRIRKMAASTHDAFLEKRGTRGLELHRVVVVRFDCEKVDAFECFDQTRFNASEVGRETNAARRSFDAIRNRARFVMRQIHGRYFNVVRQ